MPQDLDALYDNPDRIVQDGGSIGHDPVGAAVAFQATHEAEIEGLRNNFNRRISELHAVVGTLEKERDELAAANRALAEERDAFEARGDQYWEQVQDRAALERLYARAIDAQATAEKARDDARAECQKLLEENRALKEKARLEALYHEILATGAP